MTKHAEGSYIVKRGQVVQVEIQFAAVDETRHHIAVVDKMVITVMVQFFTIFSQPD